MKHYIRIDKKEKPSLSLVLGSGFSKDAGLLTTADIPSKFLMTPSESVLPSTLEEEISDILKTFWKKVFGYENGGVTPSLEDHFTLLDLAANSGHHLGRYYNPKKLRAIRRMSIHRIFQILSVGNKKIDEMHSMFDKLDSKFKLSIVTLNWDLVVERHLRRIELPFYYPIESFTLGDASGTPWKHHGIPVMKMHGSMNWIYCDSCRRIYTGKTVISALNKKTFLEKDDFRLFGIEDTVEDLFDSIREERKCSHCGTMLAGRVATFSYRKAFSIAQFQAIWERANAYMRAADNWLIIGYSMPQADFEFLHLLKSAQLARKYPKRLHIEVVIGGRIETVNRYKGYMGLTDDQIKRGGLKKWIGDSLDLFIRKHGAQRG